MPSAAWDLTALLNAADPSAALPERHLWLVRLLEWLRHESSRERAQDATPMPVLRLRQFCQVLERSEEHRLRVQGLLDAFRRDIDSLSLLADFGFAPRTAFVSELAARLRGRLLPGTPETRNLAELFPLLFRAEDAAWITQVDPTLRERLAALWPAPAADRGQRSRDAMLDAITLLTSAIATAGSSAALRLRMSADTLANNPFMRLESASVRLAEAVRSGHAESTQREALFLRAVLDECRLAAGSIEQHLEEFGVSIQIVFETDQLRARAGRAEQLLDCVLAGQSPAEVQRLLHTLVSTQAQRQSVRALLAQHSTQLSRRIAERSAETGEHYITRNATEYRGMLRAASGGGAVIAGTTFAKFALMSLGLTAFWNGLFAGLNYAISFLIIMLLHWTVATKQPAMTAPAMAAKLASARRGGTNGGTDPAAIEGFVDEVAHLIRSQMAGIIGNLAVCFPIVLILQVVSQAVLGAPLVGREHGEYVLHSVTLLGPTVLFAAFTGVLLFASSIIAGWVENWFVFHRLDSAIEWNPRILARVGTTRARFWAQWWRRNISGIAANVSLGLMLGLVPALLAFLAIPLDVRHVTLSTGQLAAALGALGPQALQGPDFWWCVAGIACTGVMNLSVSFYLAMRVALRARSVQVVERSLIYRAIGRRLLKAPLNFLRPPPQPGP